MINDLMQYCCYVLWCEWAFMPENSGRAGLFMHDNDGFSSLNKDLFTLFPHHPQNLSFSLSLSLRHVLSPKQFWCIIWLHHDFVFVTGMAEGKKAQGRREPTHRYSYRASPEDRHKDTKIYMRTFVRHKFYIFVSDSIFSVFPFYSFFFSSTTNETVPSTARQKEERNLIFVIFDQQEVPFFVCAFSSIYFILLRYLSHATQWMNVAP